MPDAAHRRTLASAAARWLPAVALSAIISAAAASERGPSAGLCDRTTLAGRAYVECLQAGVQDTDRTLREALAQAQASIEARADLAPTQRTRWKNVLDEAQGLYVRFRNFDCQNVAPYEGSGSRIGAFEERLACLIDRNAARARDLSRRYGKQ